MKALPSTIPEKKKKEGKEKVRKQDGETKRELFRENY